MEDEIRRLNVSNNVSQVSVIPEVRHRLVAMQQALGEGKGITSQAAKHSAPRYSCMSYQATPHLRLCVTDSLRGFHLYGRDGQQMPDGRQRTLLNGEDVEDEIRRLNVSNNVSQVSVIPEVRHRLVAILPTKSA